MMLRRILIAILVILAPVAFAADNAVIVTPGSGVTMKSKDIGAGVQAMQPILSDTSGNPIYGTAGVSNSNVISVQGIASGTAMPVSSATLATAANQTTINTSIGTGNTSLATIATNSGSPIPDCTATPCTNKIGNVYQQQQYPQGATPITASATGTTTAITATLAGAVGKTTYLCGFSVRANATAAATGNIAVTGTITGTLNFTQWTAPLASGIGITEPPLGPYCIPGSATNTAIVVTSAAPGSGGVVSVSAWGYQQ